MPASGRWRARWARAGGLGVRIGIPRERKPGEGRVAFLPDAVERLVGEGHHVVVERGAGAALGVPDDAYRAAGATLGTREETFGAVDLVCKVKEPVAEERRLLGPNQVLFGYLHLAADPELTRDLLAIGTTAIAFETVRGPGGSLPLLEPMSEIAGRLAILMGAEDLMRSTGRLLGGVVGVPPEKVVVIGAGSVGLAAAEWAAAMGARVVLVDVARSKLSGIRRAAGGGVETVLSTPPLLEDALRGASLVIGAALVPGGRAPKVVRRQHLALMAPGGVVVDVAIDQGGCVETARPTTHLDPTYQVDGIVHRCVTNLPGAVPATASTALSAALLPYVSAMARLGVARAVAEDPGLAAGVNLWRGHLVEPAVGRAHGFPTEDLAEVLEAEGAGARRGG